LGEQKSSLYSREVGVKYWDKPKIIGERESYWETATTCFFSILTIYWGKGDRWRCS